MNKRRYSRIAAAEHLGVSISTIRRMIERGELDTERDGPRSNGKVWVLLDDHLGNPDGVPPESSGTPGNPLTVLSDPATSPNGVPDSPVGMPDGVPSGMAASPGGVPDLATEVVLLRQQVQHMEERVKDLEQLSQERADRLKGVGVALSRTGKAGHFHDGTRDQGPATSERGAEEGDQTRLVALQTPITRQAPEQARRGDPPLPLATGAGAEEAGRLPRGELLKEEELRFHALLQELSSSHRTVETLSKALPAGPHAEPARLRWWPFRRPR